MDVPAARVIQFVPLVGLVMATFGYASDLFAIVDIAVFGQPTSLIARSENQGAFVRAASAHEPVNEFSSTGRLGGFPWSSDLLRAIPSFGPARVLASERSGFILRIEDRREGGRRPSEVCPCCRIHA